MFRFFCFLAGIFLIPAISFGFSQNCRYQVLGGCGDMPDPGYASNTHGSVVVVGDSYHFESKVILDHYAAYCDYTLYLPNFSTNSWVQADYLAWYMANPGDNASNFTPLPYGTELPPPDECWQSCPSIPDDVCSPGTPVIDDDDCNYHCDTCDVDPLAADDMCGPGNYYFLPDCTPVCKVCPALDLNPDEACPSGYHMAADCSKVCNDNCQAQYDACVNGCGSLGVKDFKCESVGDDFLSTCDCNLPDPVNPDIPPDPDNPDTPIPNPSPYPNQPINPPDPTHPDNPDPNDPVPGDNPDVEDAIEYLNDIDDNTERTSDYSGAIAGWEAIAAGVRVKHHGEIKAKWDRDYLQQTKQTDALEGIQDALEDGLQVDIPDPQVPNVPAAPDSPAYDVSVSQYTDLVDTDLESVLSNSSISLPENTLTASGSPIVHLGVFLDKDITVDLSFLEESLSLAGDFLYYLTLALTVWRIFK